jgi:hypothetical protein
MQQSDDFLRAVEARLRCPVDRRQSVIEELRGHLIDRVAALVEQGADAEQAERRAIREIGPAWILALRLSAANGWNLLAHILRGLWAAGVGLEVAYCGAFLLFVVAAAPSYSGSSMTLVQGLLTGYAWIAVLVGLSAFSLAVGRIVRGWAWALLPSFALTQLSRPFTLRASFGENAPVMNVSAVIVLLCAVTVVVAALLGQRRESPRLVWLAWASGGLIAVSALAAQAWLTMSGGFSSSDGVILRGLPALAESICGKVAAGYLTAWFLPWAFWLGAWAIERTNRVAPRDLASSS